MHTRWADARWLVVTFAMILAASCSGTPDKGAAAVQSVDASSNTGRPVLSEPAAATAIPPGFSPPQAIAGDPAGEGAWVLAASRDAETLFHWNSIGRTLDRQDLSSDPAVRAPAALPGLTVSPAGDVWIAAGPALMEMDHATSALKTFTLPPVSGDQTVASSLPESIRDKRDARSIAVSSRDGTIAVGRMAAAAVNLFDPVRRTFAEIALPQGTEAWSLAYFGDGSLAIGLRSLETMSWRSVLIVRPDGRTNLVKVSDSQTVIRATFNGDVIAGSILPSILTSEGDLVDALGSTAKGELTFGASLGVEPDGTFVAVNENGISHFDPASTFVDRIALAKVACGVGSSRGAQKDVKSELPSTCQPRPILLGVDGAGNVWFFTNLDPFSLLLARKG